MKKNYTYTKIKRTSTLSNILSKIIPKKNDQHNSLYKKNKDNKIYGSVNQSFNNSFNNKK